DNDDEEEIAKIDEPKDTKSGGDDEETESNGESEQEETREEEEESFDLIPRTPEDNENDGNGEEDQALRISEEERIHKEEEADELYHDVDINQGRGLQVSQVIEDSHMTLTPVHSDGQQESSSTSSFVTSLLNPIIDPERVKSLEVNFSKLMQTNQFAEAVSNIPESGEGDVEETKSDEESAEEETREEEEESFDPIPRTLEDSEDDGNGKEDQGLMVSDEQRLIEEEEADELYRDVDINQGWGLQVSQDIEDSHMTLTPVKPDGQQESSSVSSFVTSMLNPISDVGVESL
nr:hypothetical protein [Tanacetum cinerariifolium]